MFSSAGYIEEKCGQVQEKRRFHGLNPAIARNLFPCRCIGKHPVLVGGPKTEDFCRSLDVQEGLITGKRGIESRGNAVSPWIWKIQQ
jgi:hypothetical protein